MSDIGKIIDTFEIAPQAKTVRWWLHWAIKITMSAVF